MDCFLHIVYGVALLGFRWEVVLGSILPDFFYFVAGVEKKLNLEKIRRAKIYLMGEKAHSLFLFPSVLLLAYFITGAQSALYLVGSVYLHLFLDILTHREHGPKFLWPLSNKHIPKGLIQWEDWRAIIVGWSAGLFLLFCRLWLTKFFLFKFGGW